MQMLVYCFDLFGFCTAPSYAWLTLKSKTTLLGVIDMVLHWMTPCSGSKLELYPSRVQLRYDVDCATIQKLEVDARVSPAEVNVGDDE